METWSNHDAMTLFVGVFWGFVCLFVFLSRPEIVKLLCCFVSLQHLHFWKGAADAGFTAVLRPENQNRLTAQRGTLWNRFFGWVKLQRDTSHQIAYCYPPKLYCWFWIFWVQLSLRWNFGLVLMCTPTYKGLTAQVSINTAIPGTSSNVTASCGFVCHF